MIKPLTVKLATLTLVLILQTVALSATRAPIWAKSNQGMVATPHSAATEAAIEILNMGGNAVDAIVAASFALTVVEPYHSGIGGGEFTLLRMKSEEKVIVCDARESAPSAATPDMYIDPETGRPYKNRSWRGGLAVGVPGSVQGKIDLINRYGDLNLKKVMAPAIRLAKKGFIVDRSLSSRLRSNTDRFSEDAGIAAVFLPSGKAPDRGDILVQTKLAECLEGIAKDKGKSFYHGKMAEQISNTCQQSGGIITFADLAEYKVIWRQPIRFEYRDYTVYSMPPPSSGGVCMAQIFNILSGYPMDFLSPGSAESSHLIASAFELVFADRATWLGDPDFSPIPVDGLTSMAYAVKLRKDINRFQRKPVKEAGDPWIYDAESNTSHLSAIDKHGNMCSMTTSVNSSFGSHVYVAELGFFLNSTMDDFSIAPREPNKYELVGSDVNSIAPGKRPLSSMSPTLVLKDGKPHMSIGSVGGPRIITSVAQILINTIDFKMDIQAAIDAPRIHMQWKPDKLYLEKDVTPEIIRELRSKGWTTNQSNHWSLSQGVVMDLETGEFTGASDARGVGSAGPRGD
ncbi:MAG: gamma-glutamyltransferase [Calditrichaeota bacterium]|nr:gamma-glutamyltransferase [Calditrichota bacterium]